MSGSRGQSGKRSADRGERLQKMLARAGVASRRRVEDMIREGRITVNGKVAELGQRVDLGSDAVKVDGRRVFGAMGERRYLLLNKPAGCVSTRVDPEGRPTVIDLLPPRLRKGLVPVGRLDFETEGLLILTDDGELAQRVAHPRYGCLKTYEAKVKGRPAESEIARLRQGVMLYGKRTGPVSITRRRAPSGPRESVSNSWWIVKLGEGKTRQIREMFFRIGHPVGRLRRVAIGPVTDSHLPRGGWRELTEREVEQLRRRRPRPATERSSTPRSGAPDRPAGERSRPSRRPSKAGKKGSGGRSGGNTAGEGAAKPGDGRPGRRR